MRGLIQKTPSKTCSLDPIPTILVKQNSDVLALPIAKIVNASLRDGKFPHELKLAYVSPILKKSTLDQDELSSYRPISNLPFLAKVTEKIVACRLTSHLQEKGLHQFLQSAYKKYHSVETALVKDIGWHSESYRWEESSHDCSSGPDGCFWYHWSCYPAPKAQRWFQGG